jgi:hypothetical protein
MYITWAITNISLYRDIPAEVSNGGTRDTRVTPLFGVVEMIHILKEGK